MSRDSRRSMSAMSLQTCISAVFVLWLCLADLLSPASAEPIQLPFQTGSDVEHEFKLKHVVFHGGYEDPELYRRFDINEDEPLFIATGDGPRPPPVLAARSRPVRVRRLANRKPKYIESLLTANRLGGMQSMAALAWTDDDITGPDVSNLETLKTLAEMTSNAYYLNENSTEWHDVGSGYNRSASFGWEGDSLRGHVFVDEANTTIIVSIKGTTVAVFDGPETTTNDKVNDNLLFGCCCAAQSSLTRKVCDCQQGTYTCGMQCLRREVNAENRYYRAAMNLYGNVTEMYPDAQIWLVGHSLGGSLGALLGLTWGVPVVTFEAPGEAMAVSRIGIPAPPGTDPDLPQSWGETYIHHFGNTADPVFMGVCNGVTSSCQYGGYALESSCHTGQKCVWNVTADKGWRLSINNHRVRTVIDDIIPLYNTTPTCFVDQECIDCAPWKYVDGNGSDTTTTTSSTTTYTSRTTTCKTPGWWGCLDKTTTTAEDDGPTTTVVTITTTLTTTTTSTSITTTTSTCKTPGWFGCKDKTTDAGSATPLPTVTTTQASATSVSITTSTTSSSTICTSPGYIYGCRDKVAEPTATTTTTTTSTTQSMTTTSIKTISTTMSSPDGARHDRKSCSTPAWFGFVCRDTTSSTTTTPDPTAAMKLDM